MSLQVTFNTVIEQHLTTEGRLVLGLSGGMDSRVLLELMVNFARSREVDCIAVHVHHGLSANADLWAQRCRDWCQSLNVPLMIEHVQVEQDGQSLEERARQLRYAILRPYIHNNDLLLTGHHADDQLETLLLALKRGSGPKGLSSMALAMPFGHGQLVRPLLSVTRDDIEQYAQQQNLEWNEDESNQDPRFDRNFLRHHIVPQLAKRWPHIQQASLRTAQLCYEQESLLDELLAEPFAQALSSDLSLDIETLIKVSEKVRMRLLRMWLEHLSVRMPSREQLKLIWQQVALAQADANPQLQLEQAQVRRFQGRLYLVRQWQSLQTWQQSLTLDSPLLLPDGLGTIHLRPMASGQLSLAALSQAELRVTFEPQGLSAHPAERVHSRKLKKLFQEYGIPSWLRRRTPIILCGEQVVAVGDLFIDRQFTGQDCELVWDKLQQIV
ncbi:tRNA lysidine(34) synthetase TilS [Vibrio sinaloensis]|uniref:tRNA lysidine(34) synthetase TilS n=1 Tax=Photobacterium sp. (strain ATCC 43367) TaxID=379097 RepID=UPI002062416F|nr:tRNA lysidine(34) synthetase TilS [Vibrio sinaloensis]UPQ88568.1 tRNA lysidine(34) synthetase TilS [Vibrio sinaloensis]